MTVKQTVTENKSTAEAKWRRKMAQIRRERAQLDEIADLCNARLDAEQKKAIEIANKMRADGVPKDFIQKYTGLTVDVIQKL